MPHDPAFVAETNAQLAKAATDLRAAQHALTARPPLYADTTFHCQQAAEKAMKAFLTWHNVPFRRIHSLEEIGEQCLLIEPSFRQTVDRAVPLTEYAWKFRYPGTVDEPTPTEAEEAMLVARVVRQAVLDFMPPDART